MIEQFSPLTRRIVAVGLAILALLLLVNLIVLPLASVTGGSLDDLADARFRLARLEAIVARPPPAASAEVDPRLTLKAPSRQAAIDALIATINRTAAGYQVQVDSIAPLDLDPGRPQWLGLSIAIRGEQEKLLPFLNDLERGAPAVHFTSWSLAPGQAGATPAAAPDPEAGPPPPLAPGPIQLNLNGSATAVWDQS